jgi:hypothetical protein
MKTTHNIFNLGDTEVVMYDIGSIKESDGLNHYTIWGAKLCLQEEF